jgi:ribosomal subunit interface protein
MQTPVQIVFNGVDRSEALENHIRDKANRLQHFNQKLMRCHVTVELPHRHHQKGQLFNVRLGLHVPGDEIVVNRDEHEDVYVALREAFDAAKRLLEEAARRQRGEARHQGAARPPLDNATE